MAGCLAARFLAPGFPARIRLFSPALPPLPAAMSAKQEIGGVRLFLPSCKRQPLVSHVLATSARAVVSPVSGPEHRLQALPLLLPSLCAVRLAIP